MALDLLLVLPCPDRETAAAEREALRIGAGIPDQESPLVGFACLLTALERQGLRARQLDVARERCGVEDLMEIVARERPAVVGFYACTVTVRAAAGIAAALEARRPEVLTCLGGPYATAMPWEVLEEFPAFDFVVRGEAEPVLPAVLARLVAGDPLPVLPGVVTRGTEPTPSAVVDDLDTLPFPAWERFELGHYPGFSPHGTRLELPLCSSRGCPLRCIFCAGALGQRRRQRSVASVIREIEQDVEVHGCEAIVFTDETLFTSRRWTEELLDTLVARGLHHRVRWSCELREGDEPPGSYQRLRRAGCYSVFFGIESGDDGMLRRMGTQTTVAWNRETIRRVKRAGIIPIGSFILGLPGETEETARATIALARELDLYGLRLQSQEGAGGLPGAPRAGRRIIDQGRPYPAWTNLPFTT